MATDLVIGRKTGTLLNSTPKVVSVAEVYAPLTAVIRSTTGAAALNIELSTDGGVEYFTPTPDYSSTTEKSIGILVPITNIRFTGVASAVWAVL